ncbi:MAG: electron transfer flavoprotein subunit beta/FixA family protein [Spirochaetaceae bacterium]|nr:MAG: electron transfer flavoprotein subunit beta/FixA family protein [Spirochaetaceae bacterium]
MTIIVPIKQVPETSNVRMDPETGTMIRAGAATVVNPLDLYAIETALRLREAHGGSVTVLSMGPPAALKAVKEAIAMGCDDGLLLSDRVFAGADTWATSYTLAAAVRRLGAFDLIVAGERATDGDTAQVGPGLAAWLDVPLATYVARIDTVADGRLSVQRLTEEGYQQLTLQLPALITVVKEIAAVRLPTLRGKKRARLSEVPVLTAADLDVDRACLGLRGSPTKVVRIERPKVARGGEMVSVNGQQGVTAAVDALLEFLRSRGLLEEVSS